MRNPNEHQSKKQLTIKVTQRSFSDELKESEEMVNYRGFSSYSKNSSVYFRRYSSPLSITYYIVILFALSIFIVTFYSKDILEDEDRKPPSRISGKKNSKIEQVHFFPFLFPIMIKISSLLILRNGFCFSWFAVC